MVPCWQKSPSKSSLKDQIQNILWSYLVSTLISPAHFFKTMPCYKLKLQFPTQGKFSSSVFPNSSTDQHYPLLQVPDPLVCWDMSRKRKTSTIPLLAWAGLPSFACLDMTVLLSVSPNTPWWSGTHSCAATLGISTFEVWPHLLAGL